MDNKLRSVIQFAFYTLLFSLSNSKELKAFYFNYIVLIILFLACVYSINQIRQRWGESPKTILRLMQALNLALITEVCLILRNTLENKQADSFLIFIEFLCQATIFYLWLDVFLKYFHLQLEKDNNNVKQIPLIQIIKGCFILIYAANSCYEVYKTIQNQQKDYQIELGLELSYTIIFLYYYSAFYKIHQINSISSSTDMKSHDPFDEETIESSNAEEDQKIFDYFRYSIICCLCLIINTIIKVLEFNRTNQSYIKQNGIIIIFMTFASNVIPSLSNEQANIEKKKLVEMENRASLDFEQL